MKLEPRELVIPVSSEEPSRDRKVRASAPREKQHTTRTKNEVIIQECVDRVMEALRLQD